MKILFLLSLKVSFHIIRNLSNCLTLVPCYTYKYCPFVYRGWAEWVPDCTSEWCPCPFCRFPIICMQSWSTRGKQMLGTTGPSSMTRLGKDGSSTMTSRWQSPRGKSWRESPLGAWGMPVPTAWCTSVTRCPVLLQVQSHKCWLMRCLCAAGSLWPAWSLCSLASPARLHPGEIGNSTSCTNYVCTDSHCPFATFNMLLFFVLTFCSVYMAAFVSSRHVKRLLLTFSLSHFYHTSWLVCLVFDDSVTLNLNGLFFVQPFPERCWYLSGSELVFAVPVYK